jgi:hypothetical protein
MARSVDRPLQLSPLTTATATPRTYWAICSNAGSIAPPQEVRRAAALGTVPERRFWCGSRTTRPAAAGLLFRYRAAGRCIALGSASGNLDGVTDAVPLTPRGKASLASGDGELVLFVPSVFRSPWRLPVRSFAEVRWYSESGALFQARPTAAVVNGRDVAPAEVDLCGSEPHAVIYFAAPTAPPYKRGRRLWPRSVVMWRPPNLASPRVMYPPEAVRRGAATSLALRVDGERLLLKRALEAAGVQLPEHGAPPHIT